MIGKFKFVIEASNMGPTIIWAKDMQIGLSEMARKYPAAENLKIYPNKEWLKMQKSLIRTKTVLTNHPIIADSTTPTEEVNAEL